MCRSALHYAAANGHLQVVVVLISAGTKINVPDINGCTPLHYAAASMSGDGRSVDIGPYCFKKYLISEPACVQ
jgi:hypothetical protein